MQRIKLISELNIVDFHNILEPTMRLTFFNTGFKSDPTELFPSIVHVIVG
jgi:hypothetical protein